MKREIAVALFAALAAPAFAPAAPETLRTPPPSPAVGYACVPAAKSGPTKALMTPPPPGFKCPTGQNLLVVTRQMQDQVAGAPKSEVEVDEPGPTPPPGAPVPPKARKKKTVTKQCVPIYGGLFCCYNGGTSDCRVE